MFMNFPNLLEFSLRIVLLFPKASSTGLAANIFSSIEWLFLGPKAVRSCIQYLVDSVLPAPLSPDITIDCFPFLEWIASKAWPANL